MSPPDTPPEALDERPHAASGGGADARVRALVLRREVDDVRHARDDAVRRERRHWAVAVFGVSPSVAAVVLGLLYTGSWALVVAFGVLVTLVEGWRASRAGREAWELAHRLDELEAELAGIVAEARAREGGEAAG